MLRKKILGTADAEDPLPEKHHQLLMNLLKQAYLGFVRTDAKEWRVKTADILLQKMRSSTVELMGISVHVENETITKHTQPGRVASGCQKPFALILSFGISVQASRPSQHMSQSFRGLVAPPGPRNAIPMTAIGIIGGTESLFSDAMLLSIASSAGVEGISVSTIKTVLRRVNRFRANFLG